MTSSATSDKHTYSLSVAMYAVMLAAFMATAFLPGGRVWGVDWWRHQAPYVPWLLMILGAVGGTAVHIRTRSKDRIQSDQPVVGASAPFVYAAVGLIVVWAVLFYLLRGRTHFLGDGYYFLSILGQHKSFYMQWRELGESLIHIQTMSIIGGEGIEGARLAYQAVSIAAGVLFTCVSALFAFLLFHRSMARVLFLLGLITGGYMLLYFGYVENYSVFVLSVLVFCLLGIMVGQGRIKRWWILPVWLMTVFLHGLGVALLPATVYLLVSGSAFGRKTGGWSAATKVSVMVAVTAAAIAAFYHFYTADFHIRFAIVPLLETRFTSEGYTLFSIAHMLDCVNLLLLLLPGLPLLVVGVGSLRGKHLFQRRENRFLLLLCACALGAAFVIDPRLGMPRDWDLYSFAGVPLAITFYWLLLDNSGGRPRLTGVCMLAVILAILSLAPRVTAQINDDVGLAHFYDYTRLDRARHVTSDSFLSYYYDTIHDNIAAMEMKQQWQEAYPEKRLVAQAAKLADAGRYGDAISLDKQALKINPILAPAYHHLGRCLTRTKAYDSAIVYLRIADAMAWYNPILWFDLGDAYFSQGNKRNAEQAWLKAVTLDSTRIDPILGLAILYRNLDRRDQYRLYLEKAVAIDAVPAFALKALGDVYLDEGRYREAKQLYERAVDRGLDPSQIDRLRKQHPQLAR